jgi:predicted Fe-Mo cluster-binding NifX family protein
MTICIPVTRDIGADSPLSPHFGSAPFFMLVDGESGACRALPNGNLHHDHGMCSPLSTLAGERIDGMVVGGIGAGALAKLDAAGIRVFFSGHATVGEAFAAFQAGALTPVTPAMACAHRGHR